MKESVLNCLKAIERVELELAGCKNINIKNDIEYIKFVISTGEDFCEEKACIAKEIQKRLVEHNIEISNFYVKFAEAYNRFSDPKMYSLATKIRKIIVSIDEQNIIENGSKPFTVAMFGRMSKEYKGLLARIGNEIMFFSDLKNSNLEDLEKIRGCNKEKVQILREYLLSLEAK